jgi:hypothetical protein
VRGEAMSLATAANWISNFVMGRPSTTSRPLPRESPPAGSRSRGGPSG